MLIWNLIAAGFMPTMILAALGGRNPLGSDGFACGSAPSEEFKEMSKKFAEEEAVARTLGRRTAQEIQINVYMHVVARSQDVKEGYLGVSSNLFAPPFFQISLPFSLSYIFIILDII
jgi:hypothetical protein